MIKKNKRIMANVLVALVVLLGAFGCAKNTPTPTATSTSTPTKTTTQTLSTTATPVKPIELTFATILPESSSYAISAKQWGDELSKRTNGQVVVSKIYYSASLLKPDAILDGVGKGVADLGYVAASYTPAALPLTAVAEFPFFTDVPGADSLAEAELYDSYAPFKQEWNNNNVEVMFFHALAPTMIIANKDISSVQGLKGLKLRAFGFLNDVFTKLGSVPVAMNATDVYSSIGSGVIDGATGVPLWWCNATKEYEVTKWWVDPGIGIYASVAIVMNKTKFDSLPESAKKAIRDLRTEWPKRDVAILGEQDAAAYKAAQAAGVKLIRYSDAERTRLKEAVGVDGLRSKWLQDRAKPGVPVAEFLGKYQATVKKYEPLSPYVSPFK